MDTPPPGSRIFRIFVIASLLTAPVLVGSARNAASAKASHFITLAAGAPLPSDIQCARMIPATPETIPGNVPFNHTMPTVSELIFFHQHPVFTGPPSRDFARVDGFYTGSTDMILRWAACKWGIDEDVARAQAWTESKWIQGGPRPGQGMGDKRFTFAQCVQGSFTALWNYDCPNCCWTSWGILQTKVYYEWGTWPMIKDSTAFNADYRYADQRACMNGDYGGYFASRAKQPNSYATDIASGDLDRVLWGCIGMHYSGGWYDSHSLGYIREVKQYLASKPWLRQ